MVSRDAVGIVALFATVSRPSALGLDLQPFTLSSVIRFTPGSDYVQWLLGRCPQAGCLLSPDSEVGFTV